MLTRMLCENSILKRANHLFLSYWKPRKDCLGCVETMKITRCNPTVFPISSCYSTMTQQGGSGNKPKTPEEMKQDIDNLIGKAQSVVTDLMNPQLQEEVEKNLKRARNLVNEILYKDAEKNCGASSSSAKDSERLKPLIDKAQVFMEQLNGSVEQSKKAVDLAKQMTTVVQERSESAIKKLQKSMDEVKQELGAYKDSIKGQLDSLKREANETAAKIRDPEKKKEFVDSVQQTVAKGSVTVLRNVKKLIEKAEEKIEETQKKK